MDGMDQLWAHLLSKIPFVVAVDTRNVSKGDIFFALSGAKTHGELFLKDAAEKGAVSAVVSKEYAGESYGLQLFRVENTLVALQEMAKRWVARSNAKIIAVTGSLGKTTTKGFISQLLQTKYAVGTTKGSQNSQIGLALSLLNETRGTEDFLVLEMGMSAPGHIQKLIEIVSPDIAVITSIALVHAENFESLQDIAKAKAEIVSHPKTATAIISADSACADFLLQSGTCKKLSYSMNQESQARWKLEIKPHGLSLFENGEEVVLPFIYFSAPHMYLNALCAISVARHCGMSFDEVRAGISFLSLPEKRLQEIEKNGVVYISDCYNAAEDSVKAALNSLKSRTGFQRKIGILGHMRELGKFSEECHRNVGECALDCVDTLFCLGENCKPVVEVWQEAKRPVKWFLEFEELFQHVQNELKAGDLVLVKGARSLQLERILL